MQQLQSLINFQTGDPFPDAIPLLKAALFDATLPGLSFGGKIGQFNPLAAGGANAAPGYDADSRVNPWDYVLMLEGMMLFTAGATRRYEQAEPGSFAYPFTVRAASAGYGSAAEGDEIRAELWVPLWGKACGLKELQVLFREGRAKVGSRPARDGVDFARAMSSFGVSRNIQGFVRYSFQMRNGLSYFAVPVGRFQPETDPQVDRLADIDSWLLSFNRAAQSDTAPASLRQAQRRLETAILNLTQKRAKLLDVLIALGEAEAAVDRSLRSQSEKFPRPLPLLPMEWAMKCDDDSPEFALALALAGRNLRQRLVWVRQEPGEPYPHWAEKEDRIATWQQGGLERNLITLLRREEVEIQKQEKGRKDETDRDSASEKLDRSNTKSASKQPQFPAAPLYAVVAWIDGNVEEQRVEAIARGLSLVKLSNFSIQLNHSDDLKAFMPRAYAVLKLVQQRSLNKDAVNEALGKYVLENNLKLPRVPELLRKLAAGDSEAAIKLALKRLRASGLNPIQNVAPEPEDRTRRISAALAFPISAEDTAQMYKLIRKIDPKENKT